MSHTLTQRPSLYRIGAISKLSGVPVPTLRIWQTRYNAFSPSTTTGQHRLYEEADVRKASLLKALTGLGHGIRLIAGLPTEQLQQLLQTSAQLAHTPERNMPAQPGPPGAWGVVGESLAKRLQTAAFVGVDRANALSIQAVWADLSEAETRPHAHPLGRALDVLLVSVNTLNDQAAQQILSLAQQLGVPRTVVLYGFGQTNALAELARCGCLVHRNSLSDAALADVVQRARPTMTNPPGAWDLANAPIRPRQYSDAVLQRVANMPTQVLCECPRHVAELIGQLGRFEDYSRDCLNQSPKDTALHTQLHNMAASARALFESALLMVATHEGISLQEPD